MILLINIHRQEEFSCDHGHNVSKARRGTAARQRDRSELSAISGKHTMSLRLQAFSRRAVSSRAQPPVQHRLSLEVLCFI